MDCLKIKVVIVDKKWEKIAWDDLAMCKGEQLMHQWGIVSHFKSREKEKNNNKGIIRPTIILVEVIKINMSIKEVTKSMTSNKIELQKRIHVTNHYLSLRIYGRSQTFGIKAWLLLLMFLGWNSFQGICIFYLLNTFPKDNILFCSFPICSHTSLLILAPT
jgi:hypothetical protein